MDNYYNVIQELKVNNCEIFKDSMQNKMYYHSHCVDKDLAHTIMS